MLYKRMANRIMHAAADARSWCLCACLIPDPEVADANRRIDEEESCAAHGRNGTQGNSRTNTRTNPEVMKRPQRRGPRACGRRQAELTVLAAI